MDIRIHGYIRISTDIHGLSVDCAYRFVYPWIFIRNEKWISVIRYPCGYTDYGYTDPNTNLHRSYLGSSLPPDRKLCISNLSSFIQSQA